ncbi:MAG: ATP-binding protein, partial [Myxococcota bacterium]
RRVSDFSKFTPDDLATFAAALVEADPSDPRLSSYSQVLLCRSMASRGEADASKQHCLESLRLAERSKDWSALYAAHRNLGRLEIEQADYTQGIPRLLRAIEYAKMLEDDRAVSTTFAALGGAAHYSYAFEVAIQYLARSIEAAELTNDPIAIAVAHNQLGAVLMKTDRPAAAYPEFKRALDVLDKAQEPGDLVSMVVYFGHAQAIGRRGDPERALRLMNDGLKKFEEVRTPIYRGTAHQFVAEMNLELGNLDLALEHVEVATRSLPETSPRRRESLLLKARILRARSQSEESIAVLDRLLAGESEFFLEQSDALRLKAKCLRDIGALDAALDAHEEADRADHIQDRKIATSRAEFIQARLGATAMKRDLEAMERDVAYQRMLRNVGVFGAVAVLLLALVVFRLKLRARARETERERTYRLETIGRLTGGVAHDFNNLLTVIVQGLDLMRLRAKGDKQTLHLIEESQRAATTGADIVQQLLSFARQGSSNAEEISVKEFLNRTSALLRRTAGESMSLKVIYPEDSVRIRVDPSQLTASLINLVANSRDAMHHRGEVTVGATPASSSVKLFVSDKGEGIEVADQARIFEPFFTTKGPDKGSGIGLSMVYGFVKESGGSISVESLTGSGTTISLYFPAVAP